MLPIAPLISNPIPPAIALTPGFVPVLVVLVFLMLGVGEVIRAVLAQHRGRRTALVNALLAPVRRHPAAKRPLAA